MSKTIYNSFFLMLTSFFLGQVVDLHSYPDKNMVNNPFWITWFIFCIAGFSYQLIANKNTARL